MSYSGTFPGKLRAFSKKSDFDRVFDNTVQIGTTFDAHHVRTTSGAVDGRHDGVEAVKATGSVAIATTTACLTQALSLFTGNGVWCATISYWRTNSVHCFHEFRLTQQVQNVDFYVKVGTGTIGGCGQAAVTSTAPASPYFHVYIDSSNNLKVDLVTDAAGTYKWHVSIHQVDNYEV